MIDTYTHDEKGQRVDVHAPRNINPGDYMYQSVGDKRKHPVTGGPGGTCHHCGKAIRWEVHFTHTPSGKVVTFGETCTEILSLSDSRAKHEMVVLKRRAQNEKFAEMRDQEKQERRESFDAQYPLLRDFFTEHDFETERSGFINSLKSSYEHYGSLLPRQTEALQKVLKQREEHIEKLLSQPIPEEPLTEGRYVVEGEILSTRYAGQFMQLKALILLADGNKVFGAVPKSILDVVNENSLKGKKVSFMATIKRSDNDEHFGFAGRPSNGKVI